MTKRTSVGVPDELWGKMEKWKDSLNYSKIFQAAISEVIKKNEDYQKRLKGGFDMDETVERLREEMGEATENWHEEGKEKGVHLAKYSHYSNIQVMLAWNVAIAPSSEQEWLNDLIDDEIKERLEFDYDDNPYSPEFLNTPAHMYFQGVQDGFIDFWNEVKNKI